MKKIQIGKSKLSSSRLVYGCMRINGDGSNEAIKNGKLAIHQAIDSGFDQFDHADIYGMGQCETIFGDVLKDSPHLRQKLIITTKCGIAFKGDPNPEAPHRFDFSRLHIIKSVEGSLSRLNTDYIDILLLHRPDYLFDADEVAEALSALKKSGKVSHFGVSNFSVSQLQLLQSRLDFPLIINQVEINLHNISSLTDGTLDQCQELTITPQAWCPLATIAYEAWGNTFDSQTIQRIKNEVSEQAKQYQVEDWIIPLCWLLKHPANIQPIVGTTNTSRIKHAVESLNTEYSRFDWYKLLEARNGFAVV